MGVVGAICATLGGVDGSRTRLPVPAVEVDRVKAGRVLRRSPESVTRCFRGDGDGEGEDDSTLSLFPLLSGVSSEGIG